MAVILSISQRQNYSRNFAFDSSLAAFADRTLKVSAEAWACRARSQSRYSSPCRRPPSTCVRAHPTRAARIEADGEVLMAPWRLAACAFLGTCAVLRGLKKARQVSGTHLTSQCRKAPLESSEDRSCAPRCQRGITPSLQQHPARGRGHAPQMVQQLCGIAVQGNAPADALNSQDGARATAQGPDEGLVPPAPTAAVEAAALQDDPAALRAELAATQIALAEALAGEKRAVLQLTVISKRRAKEHDAMLQNDLTKKNLVVRLIDPRIACGSATSAPDGTAEAFEEPSRLA